MGWEIFLFFRRLRLWCVFKEMSKKKKKKKMEKCVIFNLSPFIFFYLPPTSTVVIVCTHTTFYILIFLAAKGMLGRGKKVERKLNINGMGKVEIKNFNLCRFRVLSLTIVTTKFSSFFLSFFLSLFSHLRRSRSIRQFFVICYGDCWGWGC